MFIQLLLQRFFQIHPPALILLVVIPEAEVSDLERGTVTEGSRDRQKNLPALVRDRFILFMGLHCCARAFLQLRQAGLTLAAVRRLFIAVASLPVEHGL